MTRIQAGGLIQVVIRQGEVAPQAAEADQIDQLIDARSPMLTACNRQISAS